MNVSMLHIWPARWQSFLSQVCILAVTSLLSQVLRLSDGEQGSQS